ncbi:MAG: lamin tail domain-containing protein, partial [Candidatus Eiseniibacteriota bacterium]
MRSKFSGSLIAVLALATTAPAQVVINEVLTNPGSDFDGAEFIELHNKGGSSVSIAGWTVGGTEFAGSCAGDHLYAFPAGATIPAGGYVVVAKDNTDAANQEQDGFLERFGFDADYEFFDPDRTFEFDDPSVPNMTLLSAQDPANDTQIRLLPGNGFGATCNTVFNQYEVLKLWNGNPGTGGVLQDAIEWRNSTCTADVCTGVGTSDNDAFPAFPGVGESLGRNASATDTGNSSTDLLLGSDTPGAANIPNPGPALSNMLINPASPTSSQSAQVSVTATDSDGIASMTLVYSVNAGAPTNVAMSLSGPNAYTGTIPAQLDGAVVTYHVDATDSGSPAGTSKFPDFSTRSVRWGTQTIFSVQFHSPPSDTGQSAEVGNPVNIEGVVTAEPGLYAAGLLTVQSAAGFWNGVHCFDPTSTIQVARGDSVRISGEVQEFFERTEVVFFGQPAVQILASNRPLPGPSVIGASSLTTGAAIGETYEGVYVRVNNVVVGSTTLGFGEWEITDATGTCRVDDDAFYNYVPTTGDSLVAVQGIADYSFSNRKLEPRDDADIIGPPLVTLVRYSPICPQAANAITVSSQITDNGTITRAKLYFSTNNGATYDSTNMVFTSGTNWQAAVGPYPAGTDLNYHVEVTDNTGFDGRAPLTGDYDLYVGMVTIETIQSTYISGTQDSSAFSGNPRNCAGIVTMSPGVLADNIFTIQNHWTTDPANRGIQVFTGGSVVGLVEEGDSVCVSGDVVEYFGLTQIDLHFTDSFVNHGFVGKLPAFELDTTDLPPDSTGAVPASEPWESV